MKSGLRLGVLGCVVSISGLLVACSSDESSAPIGPDLRGDDLSGTDQTGRDFSHADMTGADLSNAQVGDADFTNAVLDGANLSGVDLSEADLSGVHAQNLAACPAELPAGWICADLGATGQTLLGPSTVLDGADLSGAVMTERSVDGLQAIHLAACPEELPPEWQCLDLPTTGRTLVGPDADLGGLDLSEADFGAVDNLEHVSFAGANLTGAVFAPDTRLQDADFTGADLSGVDLGDASLQSISASELQGCPDQLPAAWSCGELGASGYTLVGPRADLSDLDLSGADLSNQNLRGVDFDGADLSGANLSGADLENADLQQATLQGLRATELETCPESLPSGWRCIEHILLGPGADLHGVDLSFADLTRVDLAGANFSQAELRNVDLTGVDLTAANFTGANLSGADLTDAELRDVIATDMTWSDTTCPDGSNSDDNNGTCL